MRIWVIAMLFGLLGGAAQAKADAPRGHEFSFPAIDGGALSLADYAGRPMLVVNTASRCGFTPQYDALKALWDRYRDRGLVVIGVPSNDFRQELADAAAVKEFCEVRFDIDFPMTDILSVRGSQAHPFFAWAAEEKGAPKWTFSKYLVGPDGRLIDWYGSSVSPTSTKVVSAVEALLPSKAE